MPFPILPTSLFLIALTFVLSGHGQIWAAPTPAPGPSVAPLAICANISGSLGNMCSSQAGVLSLIQGSAASQDRAGLGVSVPANLANAVAVQQTAQVGPCVYLKLVPSSTVPVVCTSDLSHLTSTPA